MEFILSDEGNLNCFLSQRAAFPLTGKKEALFIHGAWGEFYFFLGTSNTFAHNEIVLYTFFMCNISSKAPQSFCRCLNVFQQMDPQ